MKYTSLLALVIFFWQPMSLHSAQPADLPPLKVLIVDGFSNHDWAATTGAMLSILSDDQKFACDVATVPRVGTDEWKAWLPVFGEYDVVIQNTTDIQVGGSWPRSAQRALEEYVFSGGGLYIFHSANNAFPQWKEYNRMIGLGWRNKNFGPAIHIVEGAQVIIPAGEGGNTSHGPRADTLITSINQHPIHDGLPDQWLAADLEVYSYARGPAERVTVLSYAKEPKTGLNFPVEWVIQYGAGRVYNSTYGHYWHTQKETPPGMRCLAFQTIFRRALYWLGGREIHPRVPQQFPSSESTLFSDSVMP